MQIAQTTGIDLPLKALVWQDAQGRSFISYNDPEWLVQRHELTQAKPIAEKMGAALSGLVGKAAGSA
jgi:uncharacterized protein (DUF302 family)